MALIELQWRWDRAQKFVNQDKDDEMLARIQDVKKPSS